MQDSLDLHQKMIWQDQSPQVMQLAVVLLGCTMGTLDSTGKTSLVAFHSVSLVPCGMLLVCMQAGLGTFVG